MSQYHNARISDIVGRQRAHPATVAAVSDFSARELGHVDPRRALSSPSWSLYCLDHSRREAVFVNTADADLCNAAFYYQAQYQAARELMTLSYETLHELAAEAAVAQERLILVYSTGRCGSTLVSRAFAQAVGVGSLSEPDVFTQLVTMFAGNEITQDELRRLARSCLEIQAHSVLAAMHLHRCAIKFRGVVVALWPLLFEEFPAAKVVFLYRNAQTWATSCARAYRMRDPAIHRFTLQARDLMDRLWVLSGWDAQARAGELDIEDLLARQWIYFVRHCLAMQDRAARMFVASYEELLRAPEASLQALFAHCELEMQATFALESFLEQDSQGGTLYDRKDLRARLAGAAVANREAFQRSMSTHSAELRADFVIPGTYRAPWR
jgi:hypothetical protein